ncbi:MAG: PAS domain-containing protein [Magnetococcales bacterium]|nr:PAS domain-containing protein [Magnetococcales bacterium]
MVTNADRFSQLSRLTFYRLVIISVLFLLTHWVFQPKAGMRPDLQVQVLYLFLGLLFTTTLVYLIWLRSRSGLEMLTRLQCAMDPVLVTGLVILTGGFHSPLPFLYGLAVLNTALLLGRREALLVAGMVVLLLVVGVTVNSMLFEVPLASSRVLLGRMVSHGAAFFLTALLGGALAEKAQGLQIAFDQQQDSLANLASLNQQIIEAMPYALLSVNNQGIVRSVNSEVAPILGEEPEGIVGRPLVAIFPEFKWAIDRAGGETVFLEMAWRERILGVNLAPLTDHRQAVIGTLIVIRDLSEGKRLERELAERDKLALTGRMAAYVAHEIRNPLASILSATQMLALRESRDERRRLEQIIQEEIRRLNQLINDFLFFSRPPQASRNPINLRSFLMDVQERLGQDPRWGENRKLDILIPGGEKILFDGDHLRQVFWNLFINAAQAAPDGGRLTVTFRKLQVSGHLMSDLAKQVEVEISDDGPGIDPELMGQVLEPFFTTRSAGTGLGLAVVVQLMHLNQGRLVLENAREGTGLRVRLTMEAADG